MFPSDIQNIVKLENWCCILYRKSHMPSEKDYNKLQKYGCKWYTSENKQTNQLGLFLGNWREGRQTMAVCARKGLIRNKKKNAFTVSELLPEMTGARFLQQIRFVNSILADSFGYRAPRWVLSTPRLQGTVSEYYLLIVIYTRSSWLHSEAHSKVFRVYETLYGWHNNMG